MYIGTGVYTTNDIQEGDLIFSIKNPSLAVVSLFQYEDITL